jgi:hypothetical protein
VILLILERIALTDDNQKHDLISISFFTQFGHALNWIMCSGELLDAGLIGAHKRIEFEFVANSRRYINRCEASFLSSHIWIIRLDNNSEYHILLGILMATIN